MLLLILLRNRRRQPTARISLLVPFQPDRDQPHRLRTWRWLRAYWRRELPGVEIIVSGNRWSNRRVPFSKAEAVNRAAAKATGDVFVILDADAYLPGWVIQEAADRIRAERARGRRAWFIPYRHLFRLTRETTERVLESDPGHPLRFPSPPDRADVEGTEGSMHGHRFGAMIQIVPREAFELVGGWDERFRGWGGEDVAMVRLLDTLYHPHKTLPAQVLHLWHQRNGDHRVRMWRGETKPNANGNLAQRYHQATGDVERMRSLVTE